MKPVMLSLLGLGLGIAIAAPASADLALMGRSTVLAMGMKGVGQEGVWLSKQHLRRDLIDRGKAYTHLYDLEAREIVIIDHSQRSAQVYTMGVLNRQADAKVVGKDVRLEVTPTGRKQTLQAWSCAEHKLNFVMPAEVAGEKLSFELSGTLWLARNTAEQKETDYFVKAAADPDFFMGIPALAKSSPAQARGISEAVRRISPMGLLCAIDAETKYQGSGRMAELSRKLASRISLTYERYSTAAIKPDTFDIPKGYRVVKQ
jgi:hypothetical protein